MTDRERSNARRILAGAGRSVPNIILNREFAVTVMALVIFAMFSVKAPYFLTTDNILETARYASYVAIVGVGWTYLLIAAELDLSVGPMYSLCQIIMAWLIADHGVDPWPAFVLTIVIGCLIGGVSGGITTVLRVPSFIVTLGMLSIFIGGALVISGAFPISLPSEMESSLFSVANGEVFGIPAQVIWMLVVCLIGGLVLKLSPFGYRVYATGGNERAARQAGINTALIKFMCFVVTGGLVGLVAALSIGWLRTTSPVGNTAFTLQVIAAVIIGGAALFGGAGSVYGTVVGALILGMLSTGLVLVGASSDYVYLLTGVIIVGLGTLDVVIRGGQHSLSTIVRRLRIRDTRLARTAETESADARRAVSAPEGGE